MWNSIILMGIGDWGLGIGPNHQSPIPNPLIILLKLIIIVLEKLVKLI